jgi:hypothetical protein
VVLSDDFNDNMRDTAKWNLGVVNRPTVAFDPLVQVQETSGQLQITPRALIGGLHFNGYVSVLSWNLTNARAAVEVVQATNQGDYAETVFCLGIDDGFWYRMMAEKGQLYFQFRNGGAISSTNIPYNATAHRWWRMGHKVATNQVLFQTSSDGSTWVTQRIVAVGVPITALKIELSAGTYNIVSPTGTAIFDNFVLETPGVTGVASLIRPLLFGNALQQTARSEGREPVELPERRAMWRRSPSAGTGG